MPPRIMNASPAGGGLRGFLDSIPPITRVFALATFACALGYRLNVVDRGFLYMSWPEVIMSFNVSGRARAPAPRRRVRSARMAGGL